MMHELTREARPVLAVLLGALLAVAGVSIAQEPAPRTRGTLIVVEPGASDTPLALPMPVPIGVSDEVTREIWDVVRRDLLMTGYFNVIPVNAYVEKSGGVEPGTFLWSDWRLVKAAALAKTRVTKVDGALRADVFVYDVNGEAKIDARGYRGSESEARYLGHRIADAIIFALTGERSFFDTRIAAVGTRTGNKEIYVMDIDGQGIVPVTANRTINLSPAWSPTGDRIAFTSYKRDNADLFVKELRTGATYPVSAKPGVDSGAAFSPDGTRIALSRSNGTDSDLWIVDAKTGASERRFTNVAGIDVAPSWAPDGSAIAFETERSGGRQIYTQDVVSGAAKRVTFQGARNSDPVWSPDGEHIAFVGQDANFDVFVVRKDGTGMVRVTQDQGDNEDPSWSRDGKYLMFTSSRSGGSKLVVSSADGRSQTVITPDSSGWTAPSWGP